MSWTRITIEPEKMGGRACIRGLRMPVATVVRMVASGMSFEEIVEAHPELERADITEALEYAASLADARMTPPGGRDCSEHGVRMLSCPCSGPVRHEKRRKAI